MYNGNVITLEYVSNQDHLLSLLLTIIAGQKSAVTFGYIKYLLTWYTFIIFAFITVILQYVTWS